MLLFFIFVANLEGLTPLRMLHCDHTLKMCSYGNDSPQNAGPEEIRVMYLLYMLVVVVKNMQDYDSRSISGEYIEHFYS